MMNKSRRLFAVALSAILLALLLAAGGWVKAF
jgi:hypothetical protein